LLIGLGRCSRTLKVSFYLPAIQYFAELPFRILVAPIVTYMGQDALRSCDKVFATWERPEPHGEHDQYILWINRETQLIELAQYTVRDQFKFIKATILYEDVLRRQRRRLGRSLAEIKDFLDYLCRTAELHEVYFLWRPFLPDPDDDLVLDLAANAGCSYIVTYNLRHFRGVDTFGIEAITAKTLVRQAKLGASCRVQVPAG
jgi:hypothetical protein